MRKFLAIFVIVFLGLVLYLALPRGGAVEPAETPVGRFHDATEKTGLRFAHRSWQSEQGTDLNALRINHYGHGTGVLVADVNGDGRMDLYFLNQDGPNSLLVAKPDGTFEDRAFVAGVAVEERSCASGAFGDYDNDGDADLYVTTIKHGNLLFRNDGNGGFTDVSTAAGVAVNSHSTSAAWVDLDADGYLDLYVGNQAYFTIAEADPMDGHIIGLKDSMHEAGSEFDYFFHNNGNGSFSDWTNRVGVLNDIEQIHRGMPGLRGMDMGGGHAQGKPHYKFWTMDVTVTDFDADGWTDLYVTNSHGSDLLYRNRGDGTLENVTRRLLDKVSSGSFGAAWADLDNNGSLDLYVVDMHSDMWMGPRENWKFSPREIPIRYGSMVGPHLSGGDPRELPPDHPYLYGNACYLQDGGRFVERSQDLNLENFWPWGVVARDFDWDGDQDLFVPAGMGFPFDYGPNVFYLNRAGLGFDEVAEQVGIEPRPGGNFLVLEGGLRYARGSRAGAGLDYDNDGDVDLVLVNWNDRATLLENRLPPAGRNWIGFRLRGVRANRDAVGASVWLTAGGKTQVQIVSSAGGYLSQSDSRLVFGLGDHAEVERLEVLWPGGNRQVVREFCIGRYNNITEIWQDK